TSTPASYPLSLHDALPIFRDRVPLSPCAIDAPHVAHARRERQQHVWLYQALPERHHLLPRQDGGGDVLGAPGTATRAAGARVARSEEHTSELQSLRQLVCR